ncbi:uncharacterized protein CCOS01_08935 [Colletotrichum costaricense]|uniref:Uncharacterized protein n=1 Tax=Colletotrichum costaricense TaxID=1209916 RepID=A0AAI9YTD1_9PEZI|nr:uncharacterized protein CCOS01_08935 [Colletotrichum costaricense]KAK1523848.1 hypothetical protein CCOS01_08935 [Colletotrichum costaricense]
MGYLDGRVRKGGKQKKRRRRGLFNFIRAPTPTTAPG